MIPELFRVGNFAISPFGLLLVAAFGAAFLQLRSGLRQREAGTEDDAHALLLAGVIGAIVGGKAYYAALYRDWHLLFDRSGIVFYGSFLLASVTIAWVIRRRRLPFSRTADAVAPSVAIGYAVGRIGCFLVGDDYGVPSDLPWAIAFPKGPIPTTAGALERNFGIEIPPDVAADTVLRVHPTQIYETLAALAIWWLGRRLLRSTRIGGSVALPIFALLAAERFVVEFLRAKDDRFLAGLTVAQVISLGLLAIIALLAMLRWRAARQTRS